MHECELHSLTLVNDSIVFYILAEIYCSIPIRQHHFLVFEGHYFKGEEEGNRLQGEVKIVKQIRDFSVLANKIQKE